MVAYGKVMAWQQSGADMQATVVLAQYPEDQQVRQTLPEK